MGRVTHTYAVAVLEVSPAAYAEIRKALEAAGYSSAFRSNSEHTELIEMQGIALAKKPDEQPAH